MLPDDATPQIDCLIALAQAEHPGYGRTEQAEFYEAVHMELAPVARQLERDARKWRMRLHQLRLDVLSVMPENWLRGQFNMKCAKATVGVWIFSSTASGLSAIAGGVSRTALIGPPSAT